MKGGLTLPLVSVALVILATVGKGSDSQGSSAEESGEDEDYSKSEKGAKKTGAQHKFWIPTYQGTNPLNRRKISITTSEIEKYDKSVDVSLSGVNKNRTRKQKRPNDEEALSMPIIWSGEDDNLNKSHKYDVSMASSAISLESDSASSLSQSVKSTSSYLTKKKKISKRKKISKASGPQPTITTKPTSEKMQTTNKEKLKNKNNKKKYVEKKITSQFFDELGKATNETKHTSDYYKKLVKSATKYTKEKLGYQKSKGAAKTGFKAEPTPEIIAVNIDDKSFKIPKEQDEIEFKTSHKQLPQQGKEEPQPAKPNEKTKSKSKSKNKASNQDSSSFYDLDAMSTDSEEVDSAEDSFTEFCDYSAWSDVLNRNKTQRKGRERKPKTKPISSSYQASREMGGSSAKEALYKAKKLRQKEGTLSRKKKRQREVKKKNQAGKREGKNDNYYYDQEDYPEKKLRMRTKGEKHHAINEVKGYLEKMDNKYGGRPGRDDYRSKYDRSEKDFGSYEKRDGRTKGRDRRKERRGGGREARWNDRENDRDRWGQREYRDDRRRGYDREGQWDTGRRRGMASGRGGRESGWRDDDRRRDGRDSRRGERDGYRGRGSGRSSYRGSGRYDDRRGSGRYSDRRGSGRYDDRRGSGRGGFRGGGRDGERRGRGRGGFRGRGRDGSRERRG